MNSSAAREVRAGRHCRRVRPARRSHRGRHHHGPAHPRTQALPGMQTVSSFLRPSVTSRSAQARPAPARSGGCRTRTATSAGGVGSASDRSASCRCMATNASGSPVASQRVHVGPGLDPPADRVLHRARQQRCHRQQRQHQRHHAAGRPSRDPGPPAYAGADDQRRAGRRRSTAPAAPEHRPGQHVVVPRVGQLVGDHRQRLVLGQGLDEVVVDHDPTGAAEAGDVGVQGRRTPRRVGHQHVVDLHPLARRPARRISVRSGPSGSEVKRLNSGSTSSG